MKMGLANRIFGAAAVLFGVLILFETNREQLALVSKRSPGAGFLPTIIAIGIILCGIGIFAEQVILERRKTPEIMEQKEKNLVEPGDMRNFAIVLGVAALVVVFSSWIGLITAVTLAMIAYVRLLGREPWKISVLIGLGTGIVMFLVFSVLLKVPMPTGPWGF
ncbi:MAG: tripartite tricarboxylate transporter TctB family protein [Clostridium sp.]|nr:tripartite tricarboxylate transporter TctB family protein [Clostridium sp.]